MGWGGNHQKKFCLNEREKYLGGSQVQFKSHIGRLYIFKDKSLVQEEQQADGKKRSPGQLGSHVGEDRWTLEPTHGMLQRQLGPMS